MNREEKDNVYADLKTAPVVENDVAVHVVAVQDNIVTIEAVDHKANVRLLRNEVVYILPAMLSATGEQERLKAEILRIHGNSADVQVYEDTRGVAVGDAVELTGTLLTVDLGPGLLGQIYDGLQNPLERLAVKCGRFLQRGVQLDALDVDITWPFTPSVRVEDKVRAGDSIGAVTEGRFHHKIMAPFDMVGQWQVSWLTEGQVRVDSVVARLVGQNGVVREITLRQKWPVKVPLTRHLLKENLSERLFPVKPLSSTIRLIDTFFPIAQGGTACIPGPFGAGKTVLQQLIARYSNVDIVVIVACGERAGEVVETITEFPKLADPKGGSLIDRTIIICNTSSMPVAAREASIYTGITIGEYYRQMGLDVLLIADSTSRWAQAMRERSGRLEEIPGEEAFPAYLESSIRNLYERAGVIKTSDGEVGSLTMIGTVSPAGGNFEEPVTQATLNTVKTFLGLSADRAYKRFYPAVDPLMSWSRYRTQLASWYENNMGNEWLPVVQRMQKLLEQGETIHRMMQVTGEEGTSIEDYLIYQKSLCLDLVYLQQDAFDAVDATTPIERQKILFMLLSGVLETRYLFEEKQQGREYFANMTRLFRNLNFSASDSEDYQRYLQEIERLHAPHQHGVSTIVTGEKQN